MTDQLGAKRAWSQHSSLSNLERKQLFDKIYGNNNFTIDDEIFSKCSEQLKAENIEFCTNYKKYLTELGTEESECALAEEKHDLIEKERARIEAKRLRSEFYVRIGDGFDKTVINEICLKLGALLADIVNNNLNEMKKIEIVRKIADCTKNDKKSFRSLLRCLGLDHIKNETKLYPVNSERKPYAPSMMTATIQNNAAKNNENHIYPFPFGIQGHFPVFFCHSVFTDFMDIMHDRKDKDVVVEFEKFFKNDSNLRADLDKCLYKFILAILSGDESKKECDLVRDVTDALNILFTSELKPNSRAETSGNQHSDKIRMDAAIFLGGFPFIILEAKYKSYSIDTVLQGFQYYAIADAEFIDNNPSFLITIDRGLLHVYGIAQVNRRIISSCLLSLECTQHFFNIGGFMDILYRCFGSLRFFFDNFKARISRKSSDPQHTKYSTIKSARTIKDQPYPAIFEIKSEDNPNEMVAIEFESIPGTMLPSGTQISEHAYFKPGVYLVKIGNGDYAVLKLAQNYDIEVHRQLQSKNLAPKIIGYQKWDNYHVILMEYLEISEYDSLCNYLSYKNDLDCQSLKQSLEGLLSTLKGLGIVHGDFRSMNVLAKISATNGGSQLENLKLVDFEYSGRVNEPYPVLAMKNPEIKWPEGFGSYEPRQFEHDQFMLNQMIRNEFPRNFN